MKYALNFAAVFAAFLVLSGCAASSSESVSAQQSEGAVAEQSGKNDNVLSDDDLKRAIQQSVRDLLRSGVLDHPNGDRYVVTVSRVVNLSETDFDMDEAVQRIQSNLAVGKKVKVVYAGESNASVSPEISVSARITQRTAYVRSGKRIEYYLHLNLTEIKSGIGLWETATPILKRRKR